MKRYLLFLCAVLFFESWALAAAPIFHVYVAEKWMEMFEDYAEEERRDFVIGTLFPDIRYLGVIRREETHEVGLGIEDLLGTDDPFLKGKRLHAFVDETRVKLMCDLKVLDRLIDIPQEHQVTFVKFLEDAVLYSEGRWRGVCDDLESFMVSEKDGVQVPAWNRWHAILNDYFRLGPCQLLARLSEGNQGYLGVPPELIKKWAEILPHYAQREDVQKYVSDLLGGFEVVLTKELVRTANSIQDVKEYAEKTAYPNLVVFDIDNTLIESARQIALDPSTNGFLRKKFPENSEEVIRAIQAQVPWKLCEAKAAHVVQFFQDQGIDVIGVTKRSPLIRESVDRQLLENGIDLTRHSLSGEDELYEHGVLYAQCDKGTALKRLLERINWDWRGKTIYFVDDRKLHLEDYRAAFSSEVQVVTFEYTYSHAQHVDESTLTSQLDDFLAGQPIREDEIGNMPLRGVYKYSCRNVEEDGYRGY